MGGNVTTQQSTNQIHPAVLPVQGVWY